jgi:hypothetical protein
MTVLAPAAGATTPTPAYEPDSHSIGSLTFYDASGNVVTGGADWTNPFKYVAASSAGRSGSTKAQIMYAFPDHSKADTTTWNHTSLTSSTAYPVASPASLASNPNPIATISSPGGTSQADMSAAAGSAVLDTTAGYANLFEVRLFDTGGGNAITLGSYWSADVSFDENTGAWQVAYPVPSQTQTELDLAASVPNPVAPTTPVTLTATIKDLSNGTVQSGVNAGTVQFFDGASQLGSDVTPVNGVATLAPQTFSAGVHPLTAKFLTTDPNYTGSTSANVNLISGTYAAAPSTPVVTAGSHTWTATWTAPVDPGSPALTQYQVEYSTDNGATWTILSSTSAATSATLNSAVPGTYLVRVAAKNLLGKGSYSGNGSVTINQDATSLAASGATKIAPGKGAKIGATLSDATTGGGFTGSVTLESSTTPNGPWGGIAAVTAVSGSASVSVAPKKTTYYRWSYAGDATHAAAASSAVAVTVLKTFKASAPKIKGTFKVGKTVTVSASWTPKVKLKFQWYANGKAIKGAKGSKLKLSKSLKGKKISVKVTASKAGYVTASKTSGSKKVG